MSNEAKAIVKDIKVEQGRLNIRVSVESANLPENIELKIGTSESYTLVSAETEVHDYTFVHDAGIKLPVLTGKSELSVTVSGQSLALESSEPVSSRSLDGESLIHLFTNEQGKIFYKSERLNNRKTSRYSLVRLEQLEVKDNRLYIAGRFAPMGMVIQEWGQASYILVLQSADHTYSFGLGLHDRPGDDLPTTLRKSYFSDIKERGIDLSRMQEGFYTVCVVVANTELTLSSGILGSVSIQTPRENKLPKISLLGSCIIRDAFNSRFVPDWKNRSKLVSESFQQNIVGVVSEKYTGPDLDLSDLDTLARRYTEADLQKNFMRDTLSHNPDWVIIDLFSDARFAVIEFEKGQFITDNSWKIANSASYKKLANFKRYKFSEKPDEYISLFKNSVKTLKESLPADTKFAYVQTNAATYSRDDEGNVDEKEQIAEDINAGFRALETALLEEIPDCVVLDLRKHTQWGNKDHPWSSYVVHYEQAFYDALDEKLRSLTKQTREIRIVVGQKNIHKS